MKKLGLISLIAIIVIGSLGIGYAAWSQTLTINGHVATGTYDVVFNNFQAPTGDHDSSFSAKQVDNHTYTLTCTNLYPSLNGTFSFILKNTGTIPAKITAIKINGNSYSTPVDIKLGSDTNNDITVSISGISTSSTIMANNGTLSGSLTIHTWTNLSDGNDATPSASGSFTLQIDTEQEY